MSAAKRTPSTRALYLALSARGCDIDPGGLRSEAMRHHDEELGWMLARFQESGDALRDIILSDGGGAHAIKAEGRA